METGGIACSTIRVVSRDDFVSALEDGGIDLILSDFSLPAFDGLSAMVIARGRRPDVPVILVSGTLGEELAIAALKSGATDYILKDRLARLVPAVRRAMHEFETRMERRELEARFIEAQKMDVLDQLAGGVAHDFNHFLAAITGYGDRISAELSPESPLRKYIGEIRLASDRAAGLARQLLVFGRQRTVQPIVLDLNAVLDGLDGMLRRLIDQNIEMTIVRAKPIGHIRADACDIGQMLMNLVVNARDAMPSGGRLTIATGNIRVTDGDESAPSPAMHGDYVMLSISDTGTGMTDEVKTRLFELFFTTKPSGKGTGLGLATCQAIVRQSDGYIGVSSELGEGTTFKIYFPRVERPLDVGLRPRQSASLPRGTETLLFAEDEPIARL